MGRSSSPAGACHRRSGERPVAEAPVVLVRPSPPDSPPLACLLYVRREVIKIAELALHSTTHPGSRARCPRWACSCGGSSERTTAGFSRRRGCLWYAAAVPALPHLAGPLCLSAALPPAREGHVSAFRDRSPALDQAHPQGTLAANVLGSAASAGLSDLRGGAMRDPAAAALWRSALQACAEPSRRLPATQREHIGVPCAPSVESAPRARACYICRAQAQLPSFQHLGLQTGFCGGLTTISTWVLELSQLTIKRQVRTEDAAALLLVALRVASAPAHHALPSSAQARKHGYAYGLLTMALCVTVGILPTYFGPWGRLRAPKRL